MSFTTHRNPIAHIDTTPERVLEGLINYRWDPERQTFVPWEGVARSKPEPAKETPKGVL